MALFSTLQTPDFLRPWLKNGLEYLYLPDDLQLLLPNTKSNSEPILKINSKANSELEPELNSQMDSYTQELQSSKIKPNFVSIDDFEFQQLEQSAAVCLNQANKEQSLFLDKNLLLKVNQLKGWDYFLNISARYRSLLWTYQDLSFDVQNRQEKAAKLRLDTFFKLLAELKIPKTMSNFLPFSVYEGEGAEFSTKQFTYHPTCFFELRQSLQPQFLIVFGNPQNLFTKFNLIDSVNRIFSTGKYLNLICHDLRTLAEDKEKYTETLIILEKLVFCLR